MIVERAEIPVIEGKEDLFAEAMLDKGLAILASAPGCSSARLGRGVESPSKFILLLEWDSVQSHVDFTKTEVFGEFVGLVKPYFAGASDMEHFTLL